MSWQPANAEQYSKFRRPDDCRQCGQPLIERGGVVCCSVCGLPVEQMHSPEQQVRNVQDRTTITQEGSREVQPPSEPETAIVDSVTSQEPRKPHKRKPRQEDDYTTLTELTEG
jgi:uncharacterized Zn finger protein (UPF0148 family)